MHPQCLDSPASCLSAIHRAYLTGCNVCFQWGDNDSCRRVYPTPWQSACQPGPQRSKVPPCTDLYPQSGQQPYYASQPNHQSDQDTHVTVSTTRCWAVCRPAGRCQMLSDKVARLRAESTRRTDADRAGVLVRRSHAWRAEPTCFEPTLELA
jgi:hypothetical protein